MSMQTQTQCLNHAAQLAAVQQQPAGSPLAVDHNPWGHLSDALAHTEQPLTSAALQVEWGKSMSCVAFTSGHMHSP